MSSPSFSKIGWPWKRKRRSASSRAQLWWYDCCASRSSPITRCGAARRPPHAPRSASRAPSSGHEARPPATMQAPARRRRAARETPRESASGTHGAPTQRLGLVESPGGGGAGCLLTVAPRTTGSIPRSQRHLFFLSAGLCIVPGRLLEAWYAWTPRGLGEPPSPPFYSPASQHARRPGTTGRPWLTAPSWSTCAKTTPSTRRREQGSPPLPPSMVRGGWRRTGVVAPVVR